jgi:hypothetical protein
MSTVPVNSTRIQSRYYRTVADLACLGSSVVRSLRVRRKLDHDRRTSDAEVGCTPLGRRTIPRAGGFIQRRFDFIHACSHIFLVGRAGVVLDQSITVAYCSLVMSEAAKPPDWTILPSWPGRNTSSIYESPKTADCRCVVSNLLASSKASFSMIPNESTVSAQSSLADPGCTLIKLGVSASRYDAVPSLSITYGCESITNVFDGRLVHEAPAPADHAWRSNQDAVLPQHDAPACSPKSIVYKLNVLASLMSGVSKSGRSLIF